jgi:hypothetical protein
MKMAVAPKDVLQELVVSKCIELVYEPLLPVLEEFSDGMGPSAMTSSKSVVFDARRLKTTSKPKQRILYKLVVEFPQCSHILAVRVHFAPESQLTSQLEYYVSSEPLLQLATYVDRKACDTVLLGHAKKTSSFFEFLCKYGGTCSGKGSMRFVVEESAEVASIYVRKLTFLGHGAQACTGAAAHCPVDPRQFPFNDQRSSDVELILGSGDKDVSPTLYAHTEVLKGKIDFFDNLLSFGSSASRVGLETAHRDTNSSSNTQETPRIMLHLPQSACYTHQSLSALLHFFYFGILPPDLDAKQLTRVVVLADFWGDQRLLSKASHTILELLRMQSDGDLSKHMQSIRSILRGLEHLSLSIWCNQFPSVGRRKELSHSHGLRAVPRPPKKEPAAATMIHASTKQELRAPARPLNQGLRFVPRIANKRTRLA